MRIIMAALSAFHSQFVTLRLSKSPFKSGCRFVFKSNLSIKF